MGRKVGVKSYTQSVEKRLEVKRRKLRVMSAEIEDLDAEVLRLELLLSSLKEELKEEMKK